MKRTRIGVSAVTCDVQRRVSWVIVFDRLMGYLAAVGGFLLLSQGGLCTFGDRGIRIFRQFVERCLGYPSALGCGGPTLPKHRFRCTLDMLQRGLTTGDANPFKDLRHFIEAPKTLLIYADPKRIVVGDRLTTIVRQLSKLSFPIFAATGCLAKCFPICQLGERFFGEVR